MAEKSSTVVIEVNLSCSTCSKKIRKALCVLQEKFTIKSIAFDDKKNTVTVSGPFNPDCFIKKICSLAHKVIKNIYVKPPPPPPPPPPPVPVRVPPPPPPPPPPQKVLVKILDWPCLEPFPSSRCSCGHCVYQCPSRPCSCCHCVEPCFSRRRSFNPECSKIVCDNDPSDGCSIL